ncbi:hypothetical protein ACWGKW_29425 [Streptomyces sp. NPDC054766]
MAGTGAGTLPWYAAAAGAALAVGVGLRLAETPCTALIASVPSLLGEERYHRPAPQDPHCDHLVDLTDR